MIFKMRKNIGFLKLFNKQKESCLDFKFLNKTLHYAIEKKNNYLFLTVSNQLYFLGDIK